MSDVPPNIARFNMITLVVMKQLYERFPLGLDIDPNDAAMEAMPDADDLSGDQVFDVFEMAYETMDWLQREGFLTFENPNRERKFFNAKLTMKGLVALGYVPAALRPGEIPEPLIDKIKRLLASTAAAATKEAAKTLVIRLFSYGLDLAGPTANVPNTGGTINA